MVKSKYIPSILFYFFLAAALITTTLYITRHIRKVPVNSAYLVKVGKKTETPLYYDRAGEEIVYSVNMGNLTLGKAIFRCLPNIREGNRVLAVMSLNTRLKTFSDDEIIFSDGLTLLPVRVNRDIRNLFKHEQITEQYDNQSFTLRVVKNAGKKNETSAIFKKDAPINNPILLPHYVRRLPELKIGQVINANLAKRSYEIKIVGMEIIKVKAGTFKTYHFISTPKQIEIWLSDDKDRIPVKIQDKGMFSYSLEMNKYTPPTIPSTK
jgi:hypothetical protein